MAATHEDPPAYETLDMPTQPPVQLAEKPNSNSHESSHEQPHPEQHHERPHEYAHEDHLRVRLGRLRGRSKERSRERSNSPNNISNDASSRESSISHPTLLSSREASRENSRSRSWGRHHDEDRIKIHDDCIRYHLSLLQKNEEKRKIGYIIFRHDENAAGQVIVERVGRNVASREEFLEKLPDNMCRHASVRFDCELDDGRVKERVGFVAWVPETASDTQKEIFAHSQPIFKGFLQGLDCSVKTGDKASIFKELEDRARAKKAKKGGKPGDLNREHSDIEIVLK
ncbi:hypothetical protein TWF694_002607 [Orbilia ellipsospora]|uniref:Cofilin n=1 Tax=Orbilia ellipsospora TaxID=2528407 RepID=A0AAV9X2T7_9PEZI